MVIGYKMKFRERKTPPHGFTIFILYRKKFNSFWRDFGELLLSKRIFTMRYMLPALEVVAEML